VPSLTGFLGWLETGEVEVKRQPDDGRRRIRVMTVHGAKGLEAPIVILPDTAERKLAPARTLLTDEDGTPRVGARRGSPRRWPPCGRRPIAARRRGETRGSSTSR
jgi:ATP-dependent helicase/nuclease subunit A